MVKVKGTFEQAVLMLTVGQYENARRELFGVLGIQPQCRSAWSLYMRGLRQMRFQQIIDCQKVFRKYGIDWQINDTPVMSQVLARHMAQSTTTA